MTVRCAIYTRKSTEEGLEQAFNSLDAQRESAEAYIASQKANDWEALPQQYNDGGYSGGNLDRPAFQQLMADVEAGKVDCIVIYKIDRLSRSLADFARIMDTLERHDVTLVSVTQHFNTTSSMGRLTLNILLSFAQFEREMISERTKDKISAMRRKGKHWGGSAILGYDIQRPPESPGGARLVVNEAEAEQVRTMFELYRQHRALMPVIDELEERRWRNKAWTTKAGKAMGGKDIDKAALWRILTNVIYLGKVSYNGQVYEGEHDAIIEQSVWDEVQKLLIRNGRSGGRVEGNVRRDDAILRGLLACKACGSAMVPTYTVKQTATAGRKRYRYYVCGTVHKRGAKSCECPTLPATEIEQFVLQEIAAIGQDTETRRRVVAEAESQLAGSRLDRDAALAALGNFTDIWQALSPAEQFRVMQLLVERVEFNHAVEQVAITFRPTGIASLAQEPEPTFEGAAA